MFYHLLYQFLDINLFKYITFRGFYALVTSFLISLIIGPYIISRLKMFQDKEGGYVREFTPDGHEVKKYIPTMGGILIIISVLISVFLWCRLDNYFVWILIFAMVSYALLGGWDDYKKIKTKPI